jgi:hypothetical protein
MPQTGAGIMNTIVNFAIYQIVWIVCVRFGNTGGLISLPLLTIHLILSDKRREDIKTMGLLLVAGLLVDGTLNAAGFFAFDPPGHPIPFWVMTIWLGLATLVHHSLAWLKSRLLLCSIFGALGGPIAYWSGVRMGAAAFNWELLPSLLVLAAIWASLWPGVMHLAAKANPRGPGGQLRNP